MLKLIISMLLGCIISFAVYGGFVIMYIQPQTTIKKILYAIGFVIVTIFLSIGYYYSN